MKLINMAAMASLVLLSACVKSDHAVLVEACMTQGQSKEACKCSADLARERLPEKTFAAVADLAREGENKSQSFLQNMTIEQALQMASLAVEAEATCKISGQNGLLP